MALAEPARYESTGYFDVVGSDTGKSYRLQHGTQTNIEKLSHEGQCVSKWCFVPEGNLARWRCDAGAEDCSGN
jgi:hypothetical protein